MLVEKKPKKASQESENLGSVPEFLPLPPPGRPRLPIIPEKNLENGEETNGKTGDRD